MGATPLITTNNPQNTRSTKPDQATCNSPDTVSHRAFISLELQRLWMLLKVHSIELHAKLLRARELPAFLAAHVSPTLRAWVRWYACGRRPGAYLGVDVRVTGLTRMFSGSCVSDTPG